MSFKREVTNHLVKIEGRLSRLEAAVEGEIARLGKDNQKLLDRLMVRNFGEYAAHQIEPGLSVPREELPFDADEDLAGESIEVPEGK